MTATEATSKYHVKGTGMVNFRKYVENTIGHEFYDGIVSKVNLPNGRFLFPSKWYDVRFLIQMIELVANHEKISHCEVTKNAARYVLEVDLLGIYKLFLRVGGAKLVLSKLPIISRTYADFISVEINDNQSGYIKVTYSCPDEISDWWICSAEGAISGILQVCGNPIVGFKIVKKNVVQEMAYITIEVKY